MTAISSAQLRSALEAGALLVDVRRNPAFEGAAETITGALRREPEAVGEWASALPRAADVVVYCVHGHEVSQNVAKALSGQGLKARYLEGGIEHWKEERGAVDRKPK